MYNLASKILPLFLDPVVLALVLLVGSFLVRRRRRKVVQTASLVTLILLAVAGSPIMEGWLSDSLERQYPDLGVDSYPSAQAIVVLGGMPSLEHPSRGIINPSDRLSMALRLYQAGKAPLMALSGGNNPLFSGKVPEQSEAEIMRRSLVERGVPDAAIEVEGHSINTRENSLFSRGLLGKRGIGRIILVTSAIHMPRAAAAFRKAGFDVVAAPADFQSGGEESNAMFRWIPGVEAVGSNKAIHEWLGLCVYRLQGWI
jgi:uncharacterized SAM-binding protein YcdF (DUF218 family)